MYIFVVLELWIIVLGFHLILIDFPSQFNTLENNYRKWNNRKLFVNLCYLQELFTLWSGSMIWKNDFITKFQKFTSLNGTLSHSIWKIVSYKNATKISSPRSSASVVFFFSHWNIYTEHHSHGILFCDCSKRVLSSDMTTFDLKKIPIHLFLCPTTAWHGISSGNIKKYSYTAYLHSLHLFNFANEITMFEQTRRTRNKIFVFISIKRQIFDINSLFFFFDSFFSFLLFILYKNIGHTRIINDIKEN